MRPTSRHVTGFTLVELLVVLAISAVLASVAMPLAELAERRHKEEQLRVALRQIRGAIDAYKRAVDQGRILRKADESGYPPSMAVLVEGVEDQSDPLRRRIYLLRSLPYDPFFATKAEMPEQTWATRSYESPPDAPKPGRDVFDVHSTSTLVGLNGIAYTQW